MADRIRSVHSSSRSRTRAPTLQFGRAFSLLRLKVLNHEVVIRIFQVRHRQAHNIDRSHRHSPHPFQEDYRSPPALLSPALVRRFPFSAPLPTCRQLSYPFWGAGKWRDCQMTIKASGRLLSIFSVWILATGLFVCFAGPLPAAAGAEDNGVAAQADSQSANAEPDGPAAEPVKHHKNARHASRHHKSGKVALK